MSEDKLYRQFATVSHWYSSGDPDTLMNEKDFVDALAIALERQRQGCYAAYLDELLKQCEGKPNTPGHAILNAPPAGDEE